MVSPVSPHTETLEKFPKKVDFDRERERENSGKEYQFHYGWAGGVGGREGGEVERACKNSPKKK